MSQCCSSRRARFVELLDEVASARVVGHARADPLAVPRQRGASQGVAAAGSEEKKRQITAGAHGGGLCQRSSLPRFSRL